MISGSSTKPLKRLGRNDGAKERLNDGTKERLSDGTIERQRKIPFKRLSVAIEKYL
jgi:hypothetical protein